MPTFTELIQLKPAPQFLHSSSTFSRATEKNDRCDYNHVCVPLRTTTTTTATMPTAEDPAFNFSLQFLAEQSVTDDLLLVVIIQLYAKQTVDGRDCAHAIQKNQELVWALQKARLNGKYGRIVDLCAISVI